jgi:hypothetical protein
MSNNEEFEAQKACNRARWEKADEVLSEYRKATARMSPIQEVEYDLSHGWAKLIVRANGDWEVVDPDGNTPLSGAILIRTADAKQRLVKYLKK